MKISWANETWIGVKSHAKRSIEEVWVDSRWNRVNFGIFRSWHAGMAWHRVDLEPNWVDSVSENRRLVSTIWDYIDSKKNRIDSVSEDKKSWRAIFLSTENESTQKSIESTRRLAKSTQSQSETTYGALTAIMASFAIIRISFRTFFNSYISSIMIKNGYFCLQIALNLQEIRWKYIRHKGTKEKYC